MSAACKVLDAGGVVGIYPEGTRSRDGKLHRGNVGAARLAMATGAPIVPIGLIGTEAVQEVGRRVPRVGCHVRIAFGDTVVVPGADRVDNPKAVLRDATNRLMSDIARLSGQEYVDR
jgi:1-acyl-sn-glycerol-3-phosphate acyltransferase